MRACGQVVRDRGWEGQPWYGKYVKVTLGERAAE